MSTSQDKYGTKVYPNAFVVAPKSALHIPVGDPNNLSKFSSFSKYAADDIAREVIIGKYTLFEFCQITGLKYILSTDGEYFIFGFEFSDLGNHFGDFKTLMMAFGYILGGEDFTNPDPKAFWLFSTLREIDDWKATSPHMVTLVEEEE